MSAKRRYALLPGLVMLGVSLSVSADDGRHAGRSDGWHGSSHPPRQGHRHPLPNPNIEVIVDGLRIGGQQPSGQATSSADEGGPDICHQAGGTTWSTREVPCEERTPPARSKVWSTSP